MKKIILLLIMATGFNACNNSNTSPKNDEAKAELKGEMYGVKIDDKDAMPISEMVKLMNGKGEMNCKITGKVSEICQKKGCWMQVDNGDGTTMRVTFKDYGFFVPKDAAGKTAFMQGKVFLDTTSVESLRHYAMDGGKSKEEIEKITEPKYEMAFEAEGVILQ